MKPRNKYEKRVAELNATLHEDIANSNVERVKKASIKWDMRTFCYFTITDKIHEFNVRRLYRAYKFTDRSTSHFFFVEILREFSDGERNTYFAKQRTMGFYYDNFAYHSEIELRAVRKNFAGYDITGLLDLSVKSMKEMDGERRQCDRICPTELARLIRNNPVAETLYKTSDPLFRHLINRTHIKETCRAITIAKRHGFTFNEENIPLWLDMLHAIIACRKDWHNPVYIAPTDLRATHDRFINMLVRKNNRDRLARQYMELKRELATNAQLNEQYIKRRKRFYDMVLTDGLIECRVLPDVDAFREEAEDMQHCVYRCKYFNKPYSLILSARIGGQRIETVEVALNNYTILQCYGKHNHFTMYHDRILSLVKSNMDTIRRYNRKRNTTAKIQKAV